MSLYDTALAVTTEESERAELLYRSGNAAIWAGQLDVAIARLGEAVEARRDSPDRAALGLARAKLGKAYFLTSALDDSIKMLEAAAEEIEDPLHDPAAASIYTELARAHTFAGNAEKATDYSIKAMPPAELAGDVREIAEALLTRGVLAIMGLRYHEADALLFGGLKLAQEAELVETQLRALINISANQLLIHPKLSQDTALEGLTLARRYGKRDATAFFISNLFDASLYLAGWDLIKDTAAEGLEHDLTENTRYIAQPGLIQAYAYMGEVEEARKHLDEYKQAIDPGASVQDAGALALATATVAFVEGRFDDVRDAIVGNDAEKWLDPEQASMLGRAATWGRKPEIMDAALAMLDGFTIHNDWVRARRVTLQAGAAALRGDLEEAASLYTDAMARWEELDIPLATTLAQMDAAICLGVERAGEAAKAAIAFFTDAGNDAFVARFKERVGL